MKARILFVVLFMMSMVGLLGIGDLGIGPATFEQKRSGVTVSAPAEGTPPTDNTPPSPNPATWLSEPAADSETQISMTATTATDSESPQVEYYFTCLTCLTDCKGCDDSGWQSSPSYSDDGLQPSTEYQYLLLTRDSHSPPNRSNAVVPAPTATTNADLDPPVGGQQTFDQAPTAISTTEISMSADVRTDVLSPPVEYYFDCTTDPSLGCNDRDWSTSESYTDDGLTSNETYTYTVQARDSAVTPNENTVSASAQATTLTSSSSCTVAWDDCDDFETDTITGGDWSEPAGDIGTWSIAGALLSNVYVDPDPGVSRLRRDSYALAADNCQVMHILSGDDSENAPGFVMRSTGTDYSVASRLEITLVEDLVPHQVTLRSYTGASGGTEDAISIGTQTFPLWFGACINGSGASTEAHAFIWSSEPSEDPSTWTSGHLGTLTHDGTPAVDTNLANGLRNYRGDESGTLQIGKWQGVNDVYDEPESMVVSNNPLNFSIEDDQSATDQTFQISNAGAGDFDWSSANVSIDDCNGGAAGGDTWVDAALSPSSGLNVGSGSPQTVTVQLTGYDSLDCVEGGPYNAKWTITGSNPTPSGSPVEFNVNMTVDAVSAPSMTVSPNPISVSIEDDENATDQQFAIRNAGGGSFDWTSSLLSIDDCNGGDTGGTSWANSALSPVSGTGLTAGSQDTVTIQMTDEASTECNIGGPYAARWTLTGSNTTPPESPIVITVNLTVNPIGTGVDLEDLNIAQARIPDWLNLPGGVGVEGGLPDTSGWSICDTLASGSSLSTIQTAIDDCSSGGGGVVLIGAGTTDIGDYSGSGSAIYMKDNVVLRGSGNLATTIEGEWAGGGEHGMVKFLGSTSNQETLQDVSLPKGDTTVSINDTTGYAANGWVVIWNSSNSDFQGSATDINYPLNSGDSVSSLAFWHYAKIVNVGVSGPPYTITLDRGLFMDMTLGLSSGMRMATVNFVENAGLENLVLQSDIPTDYKKSAAIVATTHAKNIWIAGNSIKWGVRQNIRMHYCVHCSVVNNLMGTPLWNLCRDEDDNGGTEDYYKSASTDSWPSACTSNSLESYSAYNIMTGFGTQQSLIANNINEEMYIYVRLSHGAHWNVYSHNYTTRTLARGGNTDTHGLFMHGGYGTENLVEAVDSDSSMDVGDIFWGKQGPLNTVYRSRLRSDNDTLKVGIFTENNSGGTKYAHINLNLIGNHAFAYFNNIGCQYPTAGNVCKGIDVDSYGLWAERNIARDTRTSPTDAEWGFIIEPEATTDCGDGLGSGSCPGNNVEAVVAPSPGWDGLQTPDSMYFTSEEDWEAHTQQVWCQEACDWESETGIGAFGDDFTGGTGSLCKLPAEIRDLGTTCTGVVGVDP